MWDVCLSDRNARRAERRSTGRAHRHHPPSSEAQSPAALLPRIPWHCRHLFVGPGGALGNGVSGEALHTSPQVPSINTDSALYVAVSAPISNQWVFVHTSHDCARFFLPKGISWIRRWTTQSTFWTTWCPSLSGSTQRCTTSCNSKTRLKYNAPVKFSWFMSFYTWWLILTHRYGVYKGFILWLIKEPKIKMSNLVVFVHTSDDIF